MSLTTYNKKRKFSETPEPTGKKEKKEEKQLAFVIQRHKATRLHYDFRLEMEGVLKSWAVPKGPSMNPGDKRLAMMVEDHPYDYKDFEGVIPEGNYGAGIVEIWDHGTYTDIEDSEPKTREKKLLAGLAAGNLKFTMKGKKLKGEFALVKLKGAEDNSWLLIKHRDRYAVDEEYDSEQLTLKTSPINKWLLGKGKSKKKVAKAVKPVTPEILKEEKSIAPEPTSGRKLQDYIPAMLAKETEEPFADGDWLYEIKWDGYRAIADLNKEDVALYSRNGNSFLATYPIVVNALKKLNLNAVLDGEIVVLDDDGNPSFQKLQHYAENTQYPLIYYVFDLLEVNGKKLYDLPLVDRKTHLEKLITGNDVVRYSDHVVERGEDFFNAIKEKNLEGIMAKKMDSHYYPGKRTNEWLKIKHHKTEEAIIAGFTSPRGGRKYFGALVLGMMKDDKLSYVGHTGSGFNEQLLRELSAKLKPLVRDQSPFDEKVKTNMPVTWVEPKYVAELKFSEWTNDGKMRHPIFLQLREDKTIKDVVRNHAQSPAMSTATTKKPAAKKVKAAVDTKAQTNAQAPEPLSKRPVDVVENEKEKIYTIGRIKLKTTNRTKIFFPDDGVTKGDVIDYYDRMADYILPYLKDRPESLFRTPNGINQKGFFHKDAGDEAPEWVKSKKLYSESTNKDIDYLLCNNKATLLYLANLGCIEVNPWHSTIKSLDNPDYLMIDIDPSDNNTFEHVIEAANVVKSILDKAGATGYCKTSGATGLHIYVPTGKKYTYEQVKDFAYLVCMLANEELPVITTLERSLSKRSKSQIYMDYLQNRRGQTIASVYSLRPKPGATVSTPLLWDEVKKGLHPSAFNIHTIEDRLKEKGDLFEGIFKNPIDLGKCLENLA
jgi:bifunctional non-homologous end joining protein LigD